jgi:hypothetical protein
MALATDLRPSPTTGPRLPQPHKKSTFVPVIVSSGIVLGIAALSAFALVALKNDTEPAKFDAVHTVAEHGSVNAIDHRDQVALSISNAQSVADHGSVSAIEHRSANVADRSDRLGHIEFNARGVADYGHSKVVDTSDRLGHIEFNARGVADYGRSSPMASTAP